MRIYHYNYHFNKNNVAGLYAGQIRIISKMKRQGRITRRLKQDSAKTMRQ